MENIVLLVLTQRVGPFPCHDETAIVGHFQTDDAALLKSTSGEILNKSQYIGNEFGPSPHRTEEKASWLRGILVKQGFKFHEMPIIHCE